VTVYGATDADGRSLDLAPQRVTVSEPKDALEIRMKPGRRVRGVVRAADGTVVAGAEVSAAPAAERRRFARVEHAKATTAADGTFELVGLAAEAYSLETKPPHPWAEPAPTIVEPETTEVTIAVERGTFGTITVVDEAGRPIVGARVRVARTRSTGPSSSETSYDDAPPTDSNGRTHVEGRGTPERLALTIRPPPGRQGLVTASREDWDVGDTTITLARGHVVAGRVEDASGPVAGARVVWRSDTDEDTEEITADAAGRFRIAGVPTGDIRLRAERLARDASPWANAEDVGEWTTVAAGSTDVVLRLPAKAREARLVAPGVPKGTRGTLRAEGDEELVPLEFGEEGVAVLKVRPGSYAVWVPPFDATQRCAWHENVEIGTGGDVEIGFSPSATIRFRVKVPGETVVHLTDVLGPLEIAFPAERRDDGTYEVRGLPKGRWTIKVKARSPDAWLYAKDPADTAEDVVTVEPQPK
jgi:hypothetical protein